MQLDKSTFSLKDFKVPESIRLLMFFIVYGVFLCFGIGVNNIHGEGWLLVLIAFGAGTVAMSSARS